MPDTASTRDQHRDIARYLIDLGYGTRAARLDELTRRAGRPVRAFAVLSSDEAQGIIAGLTADLAGRGQDRVLAAARADGWKI
jgi:hypothetical protein